MFKATHTHPLKANKQQDEKTSESSSRLFNKTLYTCNYSLGIDQSEETVCQHNQKYTWDDVS